MRLGKAGELELYIRIGFLIQLFPQGCQNYPPTYWSGSSRSEVVRPCELCVLPMANPSWPSRSESHWTEKYLTSSFGNWAWKLGLLSLGPIKPYPLIKHSLKYLLCVRLDTQYGQFSHHRWLKSFQKILSPHSVRTLQDTWGKVSAQTLVCWLSAKFWS